MKHSDNIQEFCDNGNLLDLRKFLNKHSPFVLNYADADDIIQAFILRCILGKTIEKYDPTCAKFSTFMYCCFKNFVYTYYVNRTKRDKKMDEAISFDAPLNDGTSLKLMDIFPDEKVLPDNLERNHIYESLKIRYDAKKLKRTKSSNKILARDRLPPHIHYKLIVEGNNDREIAKCGETTSAYVGLLKKKLMKTIKEI